MKKIMIGKTKLSTNKLADMMYALVICKAHLTSTHGIGIYNYTRKQNVHHSYGFFEKLITHVPEKDPIVFRYVNGGIQVITKWGIEAEDRLLND